MKQPAAPTSLRPRTTGGRCDGLTTPRTTPSVKAREGARPTVFRGASGPPKEGGGVRPCVRDTILPMSKTDSDVVRSVITSRRKFAEWRATHADTLIELPGANLSGAALTGVDLSRANLAGARFGVGMCHNQTTRYLPPEDQPVILEHIGGGHSAAATSLAHANLSNAIMHGATFERASLQNADLRCAKLSHAVFNRCRLGGAVFSSAECRETAFLSCDLSQCAGLETMVSARAFGPVGPAVYLDVQTLLLSRGRLPVELLRLAGLPDAWIEYLPSLIGALAPIQLQSCMLSHSSRDQEFCNRLDDALRTRQVPIWFSQRDMKPGRWARDQMQEAVHNCDRLLLVVSEASMASNWVRNEIKWAVEKERRSGKRVLFPIGLVAFDALKAWECWDDDSGTNLAECVRRYHVPNYSSAIDSEPAFRRAVEEIVQALGAPGKAMLS